MLYYIDDKLEVSGRIKIKICITISNAFNSRKATSDMDRIDEKRTATRLTKK